MREISFAPGRAARISIFRAQRRTARARACGFAPWQSFLQAPAVERAVIMTTSLIGLQMSLQFRESFVEAPWRKAIFDEEAGRVTAAFICRSTLDVDRDLHRIVPYLGITACKSTLCCTCTACTGTRSFLRRRGLCLCIIV